MMEKESSSQIKKDEKLILAFLCIVVIVVSFLFVVQKNSYSAVEETDASLFSKGSLKEITFNIEEITSVTEGDIISGWCARQSDFKEYYNYGMDKRFEGIVNNYVIALEKENVLYILPTKLKMREDVNNAQDGAECGFCGFEAMIPVKYKESSDDYSVVFLVADEKEKEGMVLYDTGVKVGLINE